MDAYGFFSQIRYSSFFAKKIFPTRWLVILPPLNALRAFEASARRGSFAAAAEELGVTPAAIGQQVRHLEALIGAPESALLGRTGDELNMPSLAGRHRDADREVMIGPGVQQYEGMVPSAASTRRISSKALRLSGTRFRTQLDRMTSTSPSATGIASMSPRRNSTFAKPSFSAFAFAFSTIASVKSSPMTCPSSRARVAATKTSFPAPDPRSKTVSPGSIPACSVGMPQPRLRSASATYPSMAE